MSFGAYATGSFWFARSLLTCQSLSHNSCRWLLSGDYLAKSSQTIWLATGTLCLAVCAGVFTCVIAGDLDFVPAKTDQFQLEAMGIEADTLSPAYGVVANALETGQAVVEEAVTLGPGSIVAKVDNASLLKSLYGNYDAASCRALRRGMFWETDDSAGSRMVSGYARVLKAVDYCQGGKQKRAVIVGTSKNLDKSRLLLSVCLLVRDGNLWQVSDYQPYVAFLDLDNGKADVDWQQIGTGVWVLKTRSLGVCSNHDRFVECALYEPNPGQWTQIFAQREWFDSKNHVDIALKVLPGDKPHRDLLMTASVTRQGTVKTMLSFKDDRYKTVRVYPYVANTRLRYSRKIPATDWDGERAN